MENRTFIVGADRNNPNLSRHHLYECLEDGLLPMCDYGWNRSGGSSFSILRGNFSARGGCKICERRVEHNLPAIKIGRIHKTKWL